MKNETKKCYWSYCDKLAVKNEIYCDEHQLEMEAASEDQAWSISDED